jgi:hypothetical protein
MQSCTGCGCAFLAACSNIPLTAEDRAAVCGADIRTEPDALVLHSLPAFGRAGDSALGVGVKMLYLLAIPPLAPVPVTKRIECSIAGSKHPNAGTDRARIFDTVDRTSLERGVRAGLTDRCGRGCGDLSTRRPPAAVIRIERVEYCIRDSQEEQTYVISVKWQATAAPRKPHPARRRDELCSCVHGRPGRVGRRRGPGSRRDRSGAGPHRSAHRVGAPCHGQSVRVPVPDSREQWKIVPMKGHLP